MLWMYYMANNLWQRGYNPISGQKQRDNIYEWLFMAARL